MLAFYLGTRPQAEGIRHGQDLLAADLGAAHLHLQPQPLAVEAAVRHVQFHAEQAVGHLHVTFDDVAAHLDGAGIVRVETEGHIPAARHRAAVLLQHTLVIDLAPHRSGD